MRVAKSILAAIAILVLTAAQCIAAQRLLQQAVKADGISAKVEVRQGDNIVGVFATFTSPPTSRYPIACISMYRDFQYALRDDRGKTIAADASTLQKPPYDGPANNVHILADGSKFDCKKWAGHQWAGEANLTLLYPHLRPGSYHLKITFAPRGLNERVDLAPVNFQLHP